MPGQIAASDHLEADEPAPGVEFGGVSDPGDRAVTASEMAPPDGAVAEGDGEEARRWQADLRLAAGLALLSILAAGVLHAALGPNFVLDDWFTVGHAHVDGPWGASGAEQQVARPGAWLTYALTFGYLGAHPMALLWAQVAVNTASAVVLFFLLRRYLDPWPATAAVTIWIATPNHMSLEIWASAMNIAISVLLVLAGCLMISSPRRSTAAAVAGVLALGASVLFYEASLPVTAAAVVLLPWLSTGRFDRTVILGGAAALGVSAGWILLHWHPAKATDLPFADFGQTFSAHFGWGIVDDGPVASLVMVAALAGIVAAIVRWVKADEHAGALPGQVVVAGLVIVVLGSLPFLRYYYAPLGAGDRVNFLSSIGGSLVWTGIGLLLVRHRAVLATGMATLILLTLMARLQMAMVWNTAGDDAVAILQGIKQTYPEPTDTIVLGPKPIQRANVAALLDNEYNFTPALWWLYDDPNARGRITYALEDFDRSAGLRFDLRSVSRLEEGAYP